MFKNRLKNLFQARPAAVLKAIYIAAHAGEPMQSLRSATAIKDRGLQGDRYHNNTGHWQYIEGCQVTLITEHELRQVRKKTRIDVDNGSHRRNLVIANTRARELENRIFRIGPAIFEYEKPRPPCGYIDRVSGKGIGRALSHNSGCCIRVTAGGIINVGDTLEIIG